MLNDQLLNPSSIVVVGGSDDIRKPGGKIVSNIVNGGYSKPLYIINHKQDSVQGIRAYQQVEGLPFGIDLAILAIAATECVAVIEKLAKTKDTKAFIVISAGFSEEGESGALLEKQMVEIVKSVNGCLIGPNCVGVITQNHKSVFTEPIPALNVKGADFISGSGATAVFIMESGYFKGLKFNSVFSVGNSAQNGVEEILAYLNESYVSHESAPVKLLYMESIKHPQLLLKHARELTQKGCRIAGIKAGKSEAGSRAASSHTGAIATNDTAVNALFQKAGIVRCYGRDELATVGCIFMLPKLNGRNLAIVTHAGGPAVMLADALSIVNFTIPPISGVHAANLMSNLYSGSSVANPIDFLATGNAQQLKIILETLEIDFPNIDGIVVIIGSPGLKSVSEMYDVIAEKMQQCKKPIFPIMPSVVNASKEMELFIKQGGICFQDEVLFAKALAKAYPREVFKGNLNKPLDIHLTPDFKRRTEQFPKGYLPLDDVNYLIDDIEIARVNEWIFDSIINLETHCNEVVFPVVAKVVGPLHKTDVGGVVLDIKNFDSLKTTFHRLMNIEGAKSVLVQPMLSGLELFAGIKYEPGFGHVILCGLGGVFVEVLNDVSAGLAPVSHDEAIAMIQKLKGYKLLKGIRGLPATDERVFADAIVKLSNLTLKVPGIMEMDLNPLIAVGNKVVAVDARIRMG